MGRRNASLFSRLEIHQVVFYVIFINLSAREIMTENIIFDSNKMGHNQKKFYETYIDPISHYPIYNPVVSKCGHTFNESTELQQWIRKNGTCPTCREPAKSYMPKNYIVEDLYIDGFLLSKKTDELMSRKKELLKENKQLKNENKQLTEELNKKNEIVIANCDHPAIIQEKDVEISSLKNKYKKVEKRNIDLENMINEINSAYKKQIDGLSKIIDSQNKKIDLQGKRIDRLTKDFDKCVKEYNELKEENKRLKRRESSLESEKEKYQKRYNRITNKGPIEKICEGIDDCMAYIINPCKKRT